MPNGHDSDSGYSFSFPLGVPIVAYPLLAILAGGRYGLFFAGISLLLAALFTWEGASHKEFAKIHEKDPSLDIQTWRFNWWVFFALPGYLVSLYGLLARA